MKYFEMIHRSILEPLISGKEVNLLRDLAKAIKEIASLPVHEEKAKLWCRLNGLERVRPLVNWHMEELCWHEILPDSVLETSNPICRSYERYLRRILYQWDYLPDDKVIVAEIPYETVVHNTGIGLSPHTKNSGASHGGSVGFEGILKTESDIEKIQIPEVSVDKEATNRNYEICAELFDGILKPVTKRWHGWDFPGIALVDQFASLRGIEQFFIDLVERPKWVHAVLEKLLQCNISALEQYEKFNLLGLNNGNNEVGTSALGYTDELPRNDFDGIHVRSIDIWGFSASQIFVSVSKDMHEEFATQYDRRYLKKFGLNVIGCCEPLERKMDIIRTLPNLRVVSMSEWVDREKAAEEIGGDYVFAYKPSGKFFASDSWNLEAAKNDLEDVLQKTKNCVVEIHHNSCSTCRNEPHRIQEWGKMARELTEKYAG